MQTETKNPLLVNPTVASQMLSLSPRKLWAMTFTDSPALPFIKCGRLTRYSVVELEKWIAEKINE